MQGKGHLHIHFFPVLLVLMVIPLMTACGSSQAFHKGALAPFQTASSYRYLSSVDTLVEMASFEGQEDELILALQPDGGADATEVADASDVEDGADDDEFAEDSSQSISPEEMMAALDKSEYQSDTKLGLGFTSKAKKGGAIEEILKTAFRQVGKSYRSGGTSPAGFDCSGFTTWVYAQYGIRLPRSSPEQFRFGRNVDRSNLKRGDLVFFKRKKGISHVGIYVDKGTFIHSTSNGGTVKVSNLSEPVWDRYFAGGRRVLQ